MRIKDCYSLCIDELIEEVPTPSNLPMNLDSGINFPIVKRDYEESLNVFKAFANYVVERNRTQDMKKQFAAAKRVLDARNAEARLQISMIIANYAERMQEFLTKKKQEFKLETQRIESENAEIVEKIHNAAERQHAKIKMFIELFNYYRSALDEIQQFLMEAEKISEISISKNKFYFQAKEDCRCKLRQIKILLKEINKV